MKIFIQLVVACLVSYAMFAQPKITSFSPTSGPIGTTVTITGTNFGANLTDNIVYFGASKATVIAASANTLKVIVPAGTTYQPITVTTNALTAYAAEPFIITFNGNKVIDTGSLASRVNFNTDKDPYNVSIGDLDDDGKPDMVVGYDGFSDPRNISVLKNNSNNGNISFLPKVNFTTGYYPQNIALGDIDGDGKLDIAASNYGSSTFSILKNTSTVGNISFASKVDFFSGINPYSIAIGDLNSDGKPDIAVTNFFDDLNKAISVFINTSTAGNISFATKTNYESKQYPSCISIRDIDGDSKPDIIVSNTFGANTISVLRNKSTVDSISFEPKVDFTTAGGAESFAIGDLNGDKKPDLAVGNKDPGSVEFFKNNSTPGNISFYSKVQYLGSCSGIFISDLNGDGKPDISTADFNLLYMSVYQNLSNNDSIIFSSKIDYEGSGAGISMGDLNSDGKTDIAVADFNSVVSVFKNQIEELNQVPSITSVTNINSSQALVHWSSITGASSYIVRKYPEGTLDYTYYSPVADTFRKINNMLPGTVYNVQVKAILGIYDSTDWSLPYSFTTKNNCLSPYGLLVSKITDTSALLQWKLADANAEKIELRYQEKGSSKWTIKWRDKGITKINLNGLSSNTIYRWQVRSICIKDASNWINGQAFSTTSLFALSPGLSNNIGKLTEYTSMQILPNPNKGNFTIQMQLPQKKAATTLVLYNSMGERIWQLHAGMLNGAVTKSFTLENILSTGVYILKIERSDIQLAQKIVITK